MQYFSPDLLQKINDLIRKCGQQAAELATQPFQVEQKGPNDYVTSIDRLLDRQLTAGFSALFPLDGAIAEENEHSRSAFHAGYERLWCIDPLDGTEALIQGQEHYSVMVGLLSNWQPVAGWIYAPATDWLYSGGPNWGLFQTIGDQSATPLIPCEPPAPSAEFCRVLLGDKDQVNFGSAIAQAIPEIEFYSLGSFGLKVIEVICGRAGLYLYFNRRVKVWDTTGPVALAKAAGLICCDLAGNELSFEPDAFDPQTLAHHQPILIGWPSYIEALRIPIQGAVNRKMAENLSSRS